MITLILQLDYQTSMTKDRSLDRDLDVLERIYLLFQMLLLSSVR